MINNDVLRSVRYMLDLSDGKVIDIVRLADPAFAAEKDTVQGWLAKEGDPGFVECSDDVLSRFLDGLVIHRRGRNERMAPRTPEHRLGNNAILKKLRVAFELKDVDMHHAFAEVGYPISKPELNAFFRQPGHKNYRQCGDQALRNFLKGLTLRLRGTKSSAGPVEPPSH